MRFHGSLSSEMEWARPNFVRAMFLNSCKQNKLLGKHEKVH